MSSSLNATYQNIRLILGDQLNLNHSWFNSVDSHTLYVIAELPQEVSYVQHHSQKLCAFFAAMAEFAKELKKLKLHVVYLNLDYTNEYPNLPLLIDHLVNRYQAKKFEYQLPDEYRVAEQLKQVQRKLQIKSKCFDTEHFLLPFAEIERYFKPNTHIRMESFYRKMRRRFEILMNGNSPEGDRWNFDADNRNKLSASALKEIPEPLVFENDVGEIISRLKTNGITSFGKTSKVVAFPVNRKQALSLLEYFCSQCLVNFGRYQDSMTCQSDYDWSLYHSRLSFALNVKLLGPGEVIDRAIKTYRSDDSIGLAQVEGFIRQILGWREYIRAIYWINMPRYENLNSLSANKALPDYFWTGETKMNCMHHAIRNSLENAYAHHIQRLMVTGNFSLLAGINPDEVDAWYLGIYADALQWVELPNTRGMALHADGGLVGTKPYAASGNYINKMSDYCKNCSYSVTKKHGENSCPFNSLYWNFMQQHRERFSKNQRMSMPYRTWDRMDPAIRTSILHTAKHYIESIDSL